MTRKSMRRRVLRVAQVNALITALITGAAAWLINDSAHNLRDSAECLEKNADGYRQFAAEARARGQDQAADAMDKEAGVSDQMASEVFRKASRHQKVSFVLAGGAALSGIFGLTIIVPGRRRKAGPSSDDSTPSPHC